MDFLNHIKKHVNHQSLGLDLLRMFLGFALFVRGIQSLVDQDWLLGMIERSGFDWILPVVVAHYVALSHLVGGLMLIVGLLTRWASLVQIPVLLGAVFLHLREGLGAPGGQSLELAVLVLFLLCLFFYYGSGRWSLDQFIFERATVPEHIKTHAEIETQYERRKRTPPSLAVDRHHVKKYPGVCSCGHGIDDFWVAPEPVYSAAASSVGVLLGVSGGPPSSVVYRCRKCDEIIAETFAPEILAEFTK